jgi:hypothetical protein
VDIPRHLSGKKILNIVSVIVQAVPSLGEEALVMARSIPGMPRWVKALALIAAVVALSVIVLHVAGLWSGHHDMHRP